MGVPGPWKFIFDPVINNEPVNWWVSSGESPNIVEPLRDWYSMFVTEELTI